MTAPMQIKDEDGKIYKSLVSFAREKGFAPRTVANHLDRHGNLSRLGKGPARGRIPKNAKPVEIMDMDFPSWAAASRFFGLSDKTLRTVVAGTATEMVMTKVAESVWRYKSNTLPKQKIRGNW